LQTSVFAWFVSYVDWHEGSW